MKKLIFILLVGSLFAQYEYGKIHLKTGFIIEGENLVLDENNVSMVVLGSTKSFELELIKTIHTGKKRGFNYLGALLGTSIIITPFAITDNMEFSFFAPLGGLIIGFISPYLLNSVGIDKIKWTLLFST